MASARDIIVLAVLLGFFARISAIDCSGDLTGDVDGPVYVSGGATCNLFASVTGNVIVRGESLLSFRDGAGVNGSVSFNESSSIESSGTASVFGLDGDIEGVNAGSVNLGGNFTVNKITLKNVTTISLTGTNVTLDGLKVEMSKGNIVLCDSTVPSIEIKNVLGDFVAVSSAGCSPNNIATDIKVEGIMGDFSMKENDVARGELTLKGVAGDVELLDMKAFKLKLELVSGSIDIDNIRSQDAEIKENNGGVTIMDSFFGKINCEKNLPGVDGSGNKIFVGEKQCNPAFLM